MIFSTARDREYYNNRRKERRKQFLALLGGRCIQCGTTKNLQFDHKNPENKSSTISHLVDSNDADVKKEIKKCQLLCANCHRDKTREKWEFGLPPARHGTLHMYKAKKCRCDKCRKVMSKYYHSRT